MAVALRSCLQSVQQARRAVVSPAATWYLPILSLPGVLDPISQFDRLSSSATNNDVSCPWAAVLGWAERWSVRRINHLLKLMTATQSSQLQPPFTRIESLRSGEHGADPFDVLT